jgi:hypothetical protein
MERKCYKSLYKGALVRIKSLEKQYKDMRDQYELMKSQYDDLESHCRCKLTQRRDKKSLRKLFKSISKEHCPGLTLDIENKRIRYSHAGTDEKEVRINYKLRFLFDVRLDTVEISQFIAHDIQESNFGDVGETFYIDRDKGNDLHLYYKASGAKRIRT